MGVGCGLSVTGDMSLVTPNTALSHLAGVRSQGATPPLLDPCSFHHTGGSAWPDAGMENVLTNFYQLSEFDSEGILFFLLSEMSV